MKQNFYIFMFAIFCLVSTPPNIIAQPFIFSGQVIDSASKEGLEGVQVLVSLQKSSPAITFIFSDSAGHFRFEANEKNVWLQLRMLGYGPVLVAIQAGQKARFELSERDNILADVVVKQKNPIYSSGDTVFFDADFFKKASSRTLKDVLASMPGFSVDEKGQISYQGKSVSKVLVDGDDISGSDYGLLTKNLPAYLLEQLQIIHNYNESALMKQFDNSQEIALNLKLKRTNSIFGNVRAAAGNGFSYEAQANSFAFYPKLKSYIMLAGNNIGQENISSNNQMDFEVIGRRLSSPSALSFAWRAGSAAPIDGVIFGPNRQAVVATNTLFKISKKLNIKVSATALQDRINYGQTGENRIFITKDTSLLFEQSQFLTDRPKNGSLKTEILYLPNAKTEIRLEHKTNGQMQDVSSRSNFNGADRSWQANQNYINTQTQLSCIYSPRYGGRWEFGGLQSHQTNYQNQRYINFTSAQQNRINQDFGQANLIYYHQKNNFTLQTGIKSWNLTEKMRINVQAQNLPISLQPYSVAMLSENRLLGAVKLRYKYKKLNFSVNSDNGLWLFQGQGIEGFDENAKNKLFSSATLSCNTDYKVHNISLSLDYSPQNPRLSTVFTNFMLGQDQLLRAGAGRWASWHSQTLFLNYTCEAYENNISGNASLMLVKNPQAYNAATSISDNWYIVQNVLGRGNFMQNFNIEINRYLGIKTGNLKLNYQASKNDMYSLLNGTFRAVNMLNQTIKLHLESTPARTSRIKAGGSFMNTKYVVENNNPTQNHIINFYLHLTQSFLANDKIEFSLTNEWYLQGANRYYFPSFGLHTDFWKGRCLLGLQGSNLLGRSGFIFADNNDFSTSSVEYRILPGRVLGSIEVRF